MKTISIHDTGKNRPSISVWPAGVCIQLLAARIQNDENKVPPATIKAAMTLDGKIATSAGESKWITNEQSRAWGMHLREGADAILVGRKTEVNEKGEYVDPWGTPLRIYFSDNGVLVRSAGPNRRFDDSTSMEFDDFVRSN